jgi:hypothetical protein
VDGDGLVEQVWIQIRLEKQSLHPNHRSFSSRTTNQIAQACLP